MPGDSTGVIRANKLSAWALDGPYCSYLDGGTMAGCQAPIVHNLLMLTKCETERRMGVRLEGGPESSFPHNEGLILGKEMPPRRQAHPGAVTAYQPPFYTPSLLKCNHAAFALLQL
ncbi:hypothetical protein NQZ68_013328 [Dissostichus eleginoides]|nr:hypothetical protein NQZ68_013328 [Dissostichus eleginoides]